MEKLYESVFSTNRIPRRWGHITLIALWKGVSKRKKTDLRAYRALQIGSTFLKILVVVILNRIANWYNYQLEDQQQGFRRGRGTADGIFILNKSKKLDLSLINRPIHSLWI